MRLRAHACAAILSRARTRTRVRILAVYQLHAARVPRARRRQRGRACQLTKQSGGLSLSRRCDRTARCELRGPFGAECAPIV